jgi:proteasome lid subunit RPN8/RPN11
MMEKTLEVGDEITSTPVTECETCPEIVLKIRFLQSKWQDLQTLMKRMNEKEYAAYLLGYIQEDGIPYVTDYYIPEQEVSACEADISEVVIPEELQDLRLGWLHSHHGMGAFHSGRDEMSMNYPLNVVISTTGYVATYRHPATCGRFIRSKAEIVLVEPDRPVPGEEKIKQRAFQYNPPQSCLITPVSGEGWDGWQDGGEDYSRDNQDNLYVKDLARKPASYTKREYARLVRRSKNLLKIGMD